MIVNNRVIIDDSDSWLLDYFWVHSNSTGQQLWLSCKVTKQRTSLPRYLLNCPRHLFVDHIDGNRLNNSRSNPRIATRTENNQNIRRPKHSKKSGLPKGVRTLVYKGRTRYQARVTCNNVTHYCGSYNTIEEAVLAYNKLAKELHGKFHNPSEA